MLCYIYFALLHYILSYLNFTFDQLLLLKALFSRYLCLLITRLPMLVSQHSLPHR